MSRHLSSLRLVVVIVFEACDAEALAFLLTEKINHSRGKFSRLARFESHGALHFIPTVVRGLAAKIKALCYFF
jgi:hypothetical protein